MTDEQKRPRRIWHEGIDMAYDLIGRHPELLADCPPPSDILFVLDTVNEPKSKGTPVLAKVSKITAKLTDFLDAGDKTWMLEWFTQNNGHLTMNQQYILLLQQLLLFESVGDEGEHRIGGWDIQESAVIADRLGLNWASRTGGEAPDIMAEDFAWGRVGQSRINFARALAEERRQKEQGGPPKPKLEQMTLEQYTEERKARPRLDLVQTATALVAEFGLEKAQAIVAMAREQKEREAAEAWQPEQPYVAKNNVVQFPGAAPQAPTGTEGQE